MRLLYISWLLVAASLWSVSVGTYVCEDRHITNFPGYITSPGFPNPFPGGPYVCTYRFENLDKGTIELRFHDFMTQGQLSNDFKCSEEISIYDGSKFIQQYCTKIFSTYRSMSSNLTVEFRVHKDNVRHACGFKFQYDFIHKKISDDRYSFTGYIDMYRNPVGTIQQSIGDRELSGPNTYIWMVKALARHQIRLLITNFPGHDVSTKESSGTLATSSDTSLTIHDGLLSVSSLVYTWDGVTQLYRIDSTSGGLYVKLTIGNSKKSLFSAKYSSMLAKKECPIGYHVCQEGFCLSQTALCYDGRFCADSNVAGTIACGGAKSVVCKKHSDCKNGGHCYGRGSYCFCLPGYAGEYCEYSTSECVPECANGGTCHQGRCMCKDSYSGYRCDFAILYTKDYSWIGYSIGSIVYITIGSTLCMMILTKMKCPARLRRRSDSDDAQAAEESGNTDQETELTPLRPDDVSHVEENQSSTTQLVTHAVDQV
ncbi:uncharacterized protein [Ptychodera flava]|uniref:uncharacterized protein n=1 Tax=Ptychodera flava TaxID=63121 RepID=UPI003969EBAD